jgi:hypothetical protein
MILLHPSLPISSTDNSLIDGRCSFSSAAPKGVIQNRVTIYLAHKKERYFVFKNKGNTFYKARCGGVHKNL